MYINIWDKMDYFLPSNYSSPHYLNLQSPPMHYLNLHDGEIYREDEMREICSSSECYSKDDFICIEKPAARELQEKYVQRMNDKTLENKFKKTSSDEEFEDIFRKYVIYRDAGWLQHVMDWHDFERTETAKAIAEWCEQNNIKYTLKRRGN